MIKDYLGADSSSLKGKRFAFLLVIATTDVSLIPGITIAGASPEMTHYTPAADAEFLLEGKCEVIKGIPVSPEGIPTPAIISRASLSLVNTTKLVVDAGAKIKPNVPFITLHGTHGRDIREGSLDVDVVNRIIKNGIKLGEELSNSYELLVIGESVPAGTTTALSVLLALGYDALNKVSSASPRNPHELKNKIALEAVKGLEGKDLISKLAKVSDPMLIGVAGIVIGFKGKVLLAGGTQMVAAASIIKEIDKSRLSEVIIGTTRWIIEDKSADILGLAKQVGVSVSAAMLDFSSSKYEGLRMYEKGYVKEGVGAGGSAIMAMLNGYSSKDILRKVEEIYSSLISEKSIFSS